MQGQAQNGKIGEVFQSTLQLTYGTWVDVCTLDTQPVYVILTYTSGDFTPTLISYYDSSVLKIYISNMRYSDSLKLRVANGMLQAYQNHSSGTKTHKISILGTL